MIDFSALIVFVGLAYLDAKAPNLLVAYTLLTVATLPLDAVTLCMLGHPATFLQWARSTAYFLIVIFKCCSLVLMGMLHTKARQETRDKRQETTPSTSPHTYHTHTTHMPHLSASCWRRSQYSIALLIIGHLLHSCAGKLETCSLRRLCLAHLAALA